MNKSVITSVRPKECELIASGRQTMLVRKTRPKIETPFNVYIYMTKKGKQRFTIRGGENGLAVIKRKNGKVIGEFICDKVDAYTFSNYEAQYRINDVDLIKTCLNFPELIAYGKGKILYGWHISDLKIYDKPKELGEFWAYNAELHKRFANEEDFCCYNGTNEYRELLNECALFNTDIKRCYSCWEEWSGWCHRITRPPQSWCYVEQLE